MKTTIPLKRVGENSQTLRENQATASSYDQAPEPTNNKMQSSSGTGKEKPVAEVKTTVYAKGAELGDRTEGNQNWGETGGDVYQGTMLPRSDLEAAGRGYAMDTTEATSYPGSSTYTSSTTTSQDLKDMANETADVARDKAHDTYSATADVANRAYNTAADTANKAYYSTAGTASATYDAAADTAQSAKETAASATHTLGEKLSGAAGYTKEKASDLASKAGSTYEQGKERLSEDVEIARQKAGQTYDATAQKLQQAKDVTADKTHNVVESLRESVSGTTSALQNKTHEWVETAQHTLEQAREKAREVFVGASHKVDEATNKMATQSAYPSTTSTTLGEQTEINVKAEEAPAGGIEKLKIEAKSVPQ